MDGELDSTIGAILCDVGDVLLLFDKEVAAQIELRHRLPEGDLLAQTLKSTSGRQAMTGEVGFNEWRRAGALLSPQAVDDWLDYHGELIADVAYLLAAACEGGRRCICCATRRHGFGLIWRFHGIEQLADRVFSSAEIGLAKPDGPRFPVCGRGGRDAPGADAVCR